MASQTTSHVSLGTLRDALGDRGFGVLLFIFALPNLVPVNIPLLSAVLGLPLVLLAAQLSTAGTSHGFPIGSNSSAFPRLGLAAVVGKALVSLERVERLLRPRLTVLLSWTGERLVGIAILILALVLTLPIPFANALPACAIAIFAPPFSRKTGSRFWSGWPSVHSAWSWPRPWSSAC